VANVPLIICFHFFFLRFPFLFLVHQPSSIRYVWKRERTVEAVAALCLPDIKFRGDRVSWAV
jgi:hypothetical protein